MKTHTTQQILQKGTRTKLRLAEIDRIIRKNRIIVPPPCRTKLIELCEEGVLESAPRKNPRGPYLVYEDSFLKWLERMDE